MGRIARRVPLTFSWPIGRGWPGYLNPRRDSCTSCGGDGFTESGRRLQRRVRELLREPTLSDLAQAYAGRLPLPGFGPDVIDVERASRRIVEAAGIDPSTWGVCPMCDGDGLDPALASERQAWQPSDPPKGDGWQLWETTSEGTPLSPVFASPESLCAWAAEHATVWGDERVSADEWMRVLRPMDDQEA